MVHIKVSQHADSLLEGFVYALCGIKTNDYDHKDEDYYHVPACIDTNCHKNRPTCPRCLAVYNVLAGPLINMLRHWESATNHATTHLSPSGQVVKEKTRTLLADVPLDPEPLVPLP